MLVKETTYLDNGKFSNISMAKSYSAVQTIMPAVLVLTTADLRTT
jgi:hypothetical protein